MDKETKTKKLSEHENVFGAYEVQEEERRRYNGRLLDQKLAFWQECKDFELQYKWEGNRGHETLRHYFANLSPEERDRAVDLHWDEKVVTPKQLRLLKSRLLDDFGMYLIDDNITILEANMLTAWLDDYDNLDKKPLFDLDYVMWVPEDADKELLADIRKSGCMNEVTSVYSPGVIATIEMFTLADEALRQFVVYTYYNNDEEPLYIGASKDFYNAHYFNSKRLPFFGDVEYVGFVFFENEFDMLDARKYFIRARNPKGNQRKCKSVEFFPGLGLGCDHFVVSKKEMEQRWAEWLFGDDSDFDEIENEINNNTAVSTTILQ